MDPVAVTKISESSAQTVEMVDEITLAIREQASAMNSIAQQVEAIAQMSEESSIAAANASQSANDLDGLAKAIDSVVQKYKLA